MLTGFDFGWCLNVFKLKEGIYEGNSFKDLHYGFISSYFMYDWSIYHIDLIRLVKLRHKVPIFLGQGLGCDKYYITTLGSNIRESLCLLMGV